MSNQEEDKSEGSKIYPLDLAPKLLKPVDIQKSPIVMTAQPIRRVIAQTVAGNPTNTGVSVSGSTISIVPQVIKQGIIGQAQNQTTALNVARPPQITLTTSVVNQPQTSGTTYHVPRGPAAVANLAAPRSAVATPIRTPGIVAAPGQQSTGFVTTVRQVAPSRTPSPASSAWLQSTGMQVQNPQIVKSVVSSISTISVTSTANTTTINTSLQRISPVVTNNSQIGRSQIVARTTQQSNIAASVATGPNIGSPRQAVLHSTIAIGQSNQQIHSFKSAGSLQTIGTAVTLAQVLPTHTTRAQLIYNAGNTQHFTSNPRINVTGAINTQRQVTTTRSSQIMATRLAVPVNVTQAPRLNVSSTQGTIYTTGGRLTVPQTQNTVIGNTTRLITTPANQQQGGRLAVSSSQNALLTTSQTRITVANQQPSAVVIGTQAARLASVVSLHPVVVANSSQNARTIQTQGSKVITQPAQGQAIQLTQVPTVTKLPGQTSATMVPVTVAVAAPQTTRTINVTPAAIVSQRPLAVTSGTQAIPIAKVFPQGNRVLENTENNAAVQPAASANVFIHTGPMVRRSTSPGPPSSNQSEIQRPPVTTSVTTYSLSSGTTYYYDASSGYTVAGGNIAATRPFTPSTGSFAVVPQSSTQIRTSGITTQVHGIMSGQQIQFNPVMVVEQKRPSTQYLDASNSPGLLQQTSSPLQSQQQDHNNPLPSIGKVTSSPRPSILRKRDNEGSPQKAVKNLAPVLANLSAPESPLQQPSRPESRDNGGNSSGGSTTISATSSPDLGDLGDDSLPLPPAKTPPSVAAIALKLEQHQEEEMRPSQEMSARKKPRKQQLIGTDEPKFHMEDIQFLSENKIKREHDDRVAHRNELNTNMETTRIPEVTVVKKPAPASLLNSYRQTWKSTHNHYLRYTDVKPKDERKPTIIDLANQSQVLQKINGWKIHHLCAQMEDLADMETQVYEQLSKLLKNIESKDPTDFEKEYNRINELIKGNMQRSKIINDSTIEAKTQVLKIFEHREHVSDIITRCASKRNFKKREKC